MKDGLQISKPRKILINKYSINILGNNWKTSQTSIILASFELMELGMDRITNGRGRDWLKRNLGNVQVSTGSDHSLLGGRLIMERIFSGRSHVIGDRVYLAGDFQAHAWRIPGIKGDLWFLHELAHVWDNRSAGGFATIFGGGYSDELMKRVGGKNASFPGLRFIDGSLRIDPENAFGNQLNLVYGNNSSADYFAQTFVAAVALPEKDNVPWVAKAWMNDLIKRT
jgi:hypothetical protein